MTADAPPSATIPLTGRWAGRASARIGISAGGMLLVLATELVLQTLTLSPWLEILADLIVAGAAVTAATALAWYVMALSARSERDNRARLQQLADFDALSGLHNYRFLRGAIVTELAEAKRLESSCAVVMIDLNDFKDVNDRFGHQTGRCVDCGDQ